MPSGAASLDHRSTSACDLTVTMLSSTPTGSGSVASADCGWTLVTGGDPTTDHAFSSLGGDSKTGHASFTTETGGDPKTDLAFSQKMGGVPKNRPCFLSLHGRRPKNRPCFLVWIDGRRNGCYLFSQSAGGRGGEGEGLATQTATTDPAPRLNPDFAVSRSFGLEFPEVRDGLPSIGEDPDFRDGLPSIGEDPDFRDGLPSSGDFKGHAHPGAKVMNSSTDSETTAFPRISCIAEQSEEVRQSDFRVQNLPASVSSSELGTHEMGGSLAGTVRFSDILHRRWIPHILMDSLDLS